MGGRHGQEGDQPQQPHLEVEIQCNPIHIILENFEQMPQFQPFNKNMQFMPERKIPDSFQTRRSHPQ